MMELFAIYLFPLILCPVASALLGFYGVHLVSRKESLQLLALAQASLVGNIIGRLISDEQDFISLVFSLIFFVGMKLFFVFYKKVKEQEFVVIYLSFTALSYFLITLFPSLDSHFAVGFFGDIVSIPKGDAIGLIAIFLSLLMTAFFIQKRVLKSTIDNAILKINKISLKEEIFFVTGILLSLYSLGFLFTISFLIFPSIITGACFKNFKQGLVVMVLVSGLASTSGLALSIINSRVSTVPAQVLILVLLLFSAKLIFNLRDRKHG